MRNVELEISNSQRSRSFHPTASQTPESIFSVKLLQSWDSLVAIKDSNRHSKFKQDHADKGELRQSGLLCTEVGNKQNYNSILAPSPTSWVTLVKVLNLLELQFHHRRVGINMHILAGPSGGLGLHIRYSSQLVFHKWWHNLRVLYPRNKVRTAVPKGGMEVRSRTASFIMNQLAVWSQKYSPCVVSVTDIKND